jgi:sec-independent protein translocase protein TatC
VIPAGREERRLPFWDHVEILRRKLILTAVFFLLLVCAAFVFREVLLEFFLKPLEGIDVDLHYFKPQEKLVTYVKLAVIAGFAGTVPFLAGQITGFLLPAFGPRGRRNLVVAAVMVLLLFVGGGFLSYRIIAPTTLRFFVNLSRGDGIVPVWGMEHYIRLVTGLLIGVGLVFELPPVLLLLTGTGLVEVESLARGRKFALVVGFVTGALLTPPDIWTQIVVGVALYLLYEITLLIARLVARRRTADDRLTERI